MGNYPQIQYKFKNVGVIKDVRIIMIKYKQYYSINQS